MASQGSFAATIDAWAAQSQKRLEAIWKESAQRTFSLAQKSVPVDTGYLRASARASASAMPQINPKARPSDGGTYPNAGNEIVMTLAGATLGQTIYFGYTANYSAFVEYGTSKMRARRFVGQAAAQWPQTVAKVTQELKDRVASRPASPSTGQGA
jgi:HK97 gp10 family phage protein